MKWEAVGDDNKCKIAKKGELRFMLSQKKQGVLAIGSSVLLLVKKAGDIEWKYDELKFMISSDNHGGPESFKKNGRGVEGNTWGVEGKSFKGPDWDAIIEETNKYIEKVYG
jgi:hypothetical protein